jgi:hypothetical protein
MMLRSMPIMVIALIMAFPAAAQTSIASPDPVSTVRFPVRGTVPDQCILGEPTVSGAGSAINIRSVAGRVVTIESLADTQTLSTRGTAVTLTFAALCNYPYIVTLTSQNNGLYRQSAAATAPPGFANAVPYFAEIAWDGNARTLDADAKSRTPKIALLSSDLPTAA